jgi:hypothetical protein
VNLENLFDVDLKGMIRLKKQARTIASIKALIISNNKLYVNNHDVTEKELVFVHYYLDKNMYGDYPHKLRVSHIRKRLGLPENWKPNTLVQNIIDELTDDFKTVSEKSIVMLSDTLHRFIDVLTAVGQRNEAKLEALNDLDVTSLDDESEGKRITILSQLESDLVKTLKLVTELPKAIKQLDELKEAVKREGKVDKNVGNRKSNRWEDD